MAHPPSLVALVGFMGSGKSTVGALLARRLGWRFVDLDERIQQGAGKSIRRIFEEDGEQVFRELESRALRDLPVRAGEAPGLVVAAGGGAPLRPENRRWFRRRALTFHLEISFDTFLRRTARDRERPLLRGSPEELRRLYQSRLPAYREAGQSVDADAPGPEQVVDEMLRILRERGLPEAS